MSKLTILENSEQWPSDSRAIHYGDGLFETIRIQSGQLQNLSRHLKRLKDGLLRLEFSSPSDIIDQLTLHLAGLELHIPFGVLKVIVTRKQTQRSYQVHPDATTQIYIQFKNINRVDYQPLKLEFCPFELTPSKYLAGIKHLNRLENVMAANSIPIGFDDVLTLNAEGQILESTMSNIFYSFDGVSWFITPNESHIIQGTMQDKIVAYLAAKQVNIEQRYLHKNEVSQIGQYQLTISEQLWQYRQYSLEAE